MAEVSRRRGVFGRFLTAFGFIWLLWALFGELVTLELGATPIELPLLPGILFLFAGRALSRGARVRPATSEPEEPRQSETPRPARRPVEPRYPVSRPRLEEPESIGMEEPVVVEEVVAEPMKAELDAIPEETGVRKTSAEMVAEARERFGRRSG